MPKTGFFAAPLILLCLLALNCSAQDSDDRDSIDAVLDDFHQAASDADMQRYLDHFAPDGVFMGTDDWERWPLEAFRDYVQQRFSAGVGWHYVPEDRHLGFAGDGNTAWFDEIMVSPRWGRFRGTGVLLRSDNGWKIAHYSLTALVPNERFEDVSKVTTEGFKSRGKTPASQ